MFPMKNSEIADVFERVADLLEFEGANPFRIRAYRNGARTIRDLTEPVTEILRDPDRSLVDIPGIGKDLAEKCRSLVDTGTMAMLDELTARIPASVLTIVRIPGLGPKKASAIYKQLGISTLDQLRAACEAHHIRELKGFGQKTEDLILQGIGLAEKSQQRVLWATADELVQDLRNHLGRCEAIEQLEFAGSYRRGKETVGDLDVLVAATHGGDVMDCLAEYRLVTAVLQRGDTKMSVRLKSGMQVDLRIVPADSFGAALQYFTGSKDHNVVVRGLAKQRGLKVNEWGVFRLKDDRKIAGTNEEEVYGTLGLPCFPPELREARREFEWAEQAAIPRLIELDDLRGDLHMHTDETDGKNTLDEMIEAARALGFNYIAITDHSQRVSMARGLDERRLLRQWKKIDRRNEQLADFRVLKGIECDILEAGGMDLPDDVLAQADWVMASIHYGQRQSRQQITDRILGALENPYVSALSHPTGRLINKREAYDVDMSAVMQAAKAHGKALELNANPLRLDLDDVMCATAKQMGIPIVISSDAHSTSGLEVLRYGILQARRAGLTRQDVLNTRPWRTVLRESARR